MSQSLAKLTFQKKDVLLATQIPITTFQHWTDRRVIKLAGDDVPSNAPGHARRFGLRSIYKIAIAYRISQLGVSANIALTLASKFTDEAQRGRDFGKLYPLGATLLVATPDGTGSIINLQPDQQLTSVLHDDTALVIDIGRIITKVDSRIMDLK